MNLIIFCRRGARWQYSTLAPTFFLIKQCLVNCIFIGSVIAMQHWKREKISWSEREHGQGTALWCHVLGAVSGSLACFCLWFLLVDTQALAHSLITDVNNSVSIGSKQNIQCFSVTLGSKALQSLLTTLSGCI